MAVVSCAGIVAVAESELPLLPRRCRRSGSGGARWVTGVNSCQVKMYETDVFAAAGQLQTSALLSGWVWPFIFSSRICVNDDVEVHGVVPVSC